MNVLSLFDGISCARVALGDKVKVYYAAEIDPYAIKIAKKNFPTTIHVGDVTKITKEDIKYPLDLLIGGSPCQDLSIATKERKGLKGDRSKLFWEYVRLLKELRPKYFILENVNSMSKEDKATITETLSVEPIMINASLVSAQSRKRLFWTNIKNVTQPTDRNIKLKDILQEGIKEDIPTAPFTELRGKTSSQIGYYGSINQSKRGGQGMRVYSVDKKAATSGSGYYKVDVIRKLTPIECERLQSLPDNYTEGISNTQRYKCLRNAFNVEVVKHILSYI
jgi:DNA (cytosine-5)-methyltransferase 3A